MAGYLCFPNRKNKKMPLKGVFWRDESRAYWKVLRVGFLRSESAISVFFRLRRKYLKLNVWFLGWRSFWAFPGTRKCWEFRGRPKAVLQKGAKGFPHIVRAEKCFTVLTGKDIG